MNLLALYEKTLAERAMCPDPAQAQAMRALARVAADIRHRPLRRAAPAWLGRFMGKAPPAPARGVYLWGGVGRGKTFMMDLFCHALPPGWCLRQHFHRLMNRVHGELRTLHDAPDPLATVAGRLAGEARVLCFDEFYVTDIGDAMILARLLDALFAHGMALVATSNTAPRELYRGGLQRQRFLPAIDLIERHTEVIHVDGAVDYRLRVLESAALWHCPLDGDSDRQLTERFARIAPDSDGHDRPLEVLGRLIPIRRRSDGVAWFRFDDLCGGPRSADDYIEISRCFQTLIVSGIPLLTALRDNEARRFIALIDELYERRVKLIASAAAPIPALYSGTRLAREFERTRSRLIEMQSRAYLAAGHLP